MNKKEIGELKNQFKLDNAKLVLKKIITAYVREGNGVLATHTQEYATMDKTQQELFLLTFKKALGGKLESNLHELDFNTTVSTNETLLFLRSLANDYSADKVSTLFDNIAKVSTYEGDYTINLLYGQYQKKPIKKKGEEPIEFAPYTFMYCTINPLNPPTKTVYFNPQKNEIGVTPNILKEIGLKTPLDGFVYPAYTDFASNVNNVIYYTNKAQEMNTDLITKVLDCKVPTIIESEKGSFEHLLSLFVTEADGVSVINQVYKELLTLQEQKGAEAILSAEQLTEILTHCGLTISLSQVQETYTDLFGEMPLVLGAITPKGKVQIVAPNLNIKLPQDILDTIEFITDIEGNRKLTVSISNEDLILNNIHIHAVDR